MLIRHSLAVLPVLLVTSLLAGHAPAVNAEPVYACASRYFGFMRLVKHPQKCRRRETLVTFPGASGGGDGDQEARIDALEADNEALSAELQVLKDANDALEAKLEALKQADGALIADIQVLQEANAQLKADMAASSPPAPVSQGKLACISDQSTATDLIFEGCNVRIVNGLGATDSLNGAGLGNLIIGYDEDGAGDKDRTGSHNLVIGGEHAYSSYGGLVAGYRNSITGSNASVTGGSFNTASGPKSSVSGGYSNVASGDLASVSGGTSNDAQGSHSSVSGGFDNQAVGSYAGVSGGAGNEATGDYASVSGGFQNRASGGYSSVTGGGGNVASGQEANVSGGGNNEAAAYQASVSGGMGNYADGPNSSILGGDGYETMMDNETVPPL